MQSLISYRQSRPPLCWFLGSSGRIYEPCYQRASARYRSSVVLIITT